MIEDLGFIDNLMLHGGVVRRGGTVVVGNAPPEALYTDLTAFRQVLAIAAQQLLLNGKGPGMTRAFRFLWLWSLTISRPSAPAPAGP